MIVIVDIDQVVLDNEHRVRFIESQPKDWTKFYSKKYVLKDTPIAAGVALVQSLMKDKHSVYFVTGRSEECREATLQCLQKHVGSYIVDESLYMRPKDDFRSQGALKALLVKKMAKNKIPKPDLAIDNDYGACKSYLELGIPTMYFVVPEEE